MTAPPAEGYRSWGGLVARDSEIVPARDWMGCPGRHRSPALAYGNGRSYGDSCLNNGGALIDARGLDRVLAFDRESGLLTCGAGLRLDHLLLSEAMAKRMKDAGVDREVRGEADASDHAPVWIEVK